MEDKIGEDRIKRIVDQYKLCVHCIHFSPGVDLISISPLCNPSEKKFCSNYEARDEFKKED